ncbi:MAG: hypothetical protein BRC25_00050 [Parcubacteria group bacterium SW_6_46_9]|nr:MAG: hypothetical protein BRC25_00050 [Parcubacteria group bacterium SW_6_46_9]
MRIFLTMRCGRLSGPDFPVGHKSTRTSHHNHCSPHNCHAFVAGRPISPDNMIKVDGKTIQKDIKRKLCARCAQREETMRLDLFYIGSNDTIETYIALKKRFGENIGVQVVGHTFSADTKEEKIRDSLQTVANSKAVDGMVLQLPVPETLADDLRNEIPASEDVDVLSDDRRSAFSAGESAILPPVVAAIAEICRRHEIMLENKSVAVVGRGRLVGGPAVTWLQNQGIEPAVYEKGDDLTGLVSADVIISGAGDPHVITPDINNEQAILFDAGTSQSDGGLCGDVHPESYQKARLITPVPGGIGPITVAKLFENLVVLASKS